MKKLGAVAFGCAVLAAAGFAWAQETGATVDLQPETQPPAAAAPPPAAAAPAPRPATPANKPAAAPKPATAAAKKNEPFDPFKMGQPPPPPALKPTTPVALVMRALDKITGRATVITAPINQPIQYATLTIVARYCYSTPQSETPETSAFVQIEDHRPDQKARRVFSGWMYASSPGLNGMEHPLYDVWVIRCRTDAPGVAKSVAAAVKPKSPNAAATDEPVDLPEDADQ
jgi:hypothetical protein